MSRRPAGIPVRAAALAALVLCCAAGTANAQRADPAASPGATVVAGKARITVLTPGLVRLEYAEDGRFEDRPTFFVPHRDFPAPAFAVDSADGWIEIRTGRLRLRHRPGSGPFDAANTRVETADDDGAYRTVEPAWSGGAPAALGGWRHDLPVAREVPMHDGLLRREGWSLIDDGETPTLAGEWVEPRAPRTGAHRDLYLFVYGQDYAAALGDFTRLTGRAPLLPRWAFGVWFSRLRRHVYGDAAYRQDVVPAFRAERVPLDVIIVDTDFKGPDRWNGWGWSEKLFPDPQGFMAWADAEGLRVSLNIHPSIRRSDPAFARADSIAGGLVDVTGQCPKWQRGTEPCSAWDWAVPAHAESYFALHAPFEAEGVDVWWLDWCCDASRVSMPGLTGDTWINHLYARRLEQQGRRGFVLSRLGASWQDQHAPRPGAWAEHRSTVHFTGDTHPTWEMLDFQTEFTVREGSTGIPYVSHDVGSFHAGGPRDEELSHDMYVRWIQHGTFQPILRIHGHGKRLPWEFEGATRETAARFLRLRAALAPYLYTLAREAHDTGLPMARGMYLEHPADEESYTFSRQYLLGRAMLVAPVAAPGDVASKRVWFPAGLWTDFFTGETYRGPAVRTLEVPLERMPVFVRAGGIVPMQPPGRRVGTAPPDTLVLRVYAGADGRFELYEDEGEGLGYRDGVFARTAIEYRERGGTLTVGAARGDYPGMPTARSYRIELVGVDRPETITVGGSALAADGWSHDAAARTLVVHVASAPTDLPLEVAHDGATR